jgi:hypothetical protein
MCRWRITSDMQAAELSRYAGSPRRSAEFWCGRHDRPGGYALLASALARCQQGTRVKRTVSSGYPVQWTHPLQQTELLQRHEPRLIHERVGELHRLCAATTPLRLPHKVTDVLRPSLTSTATDLVQPQTSCREEIYLAKIRAVACLPYPLRLSARCPAR